MSYISSERAFWLSIRFSRPMRFSTRMPRSKRSPYFRREDFLLAMVGLTVWNGWKEMCDHVIPRASGASAVKGATEEITMKFKLHAALMIGLAAAAPAAAQQKKPEAGAAAYPT